MNENEMYTAPVVDVIEVEVEKGFASSDDPEGEGDDFIRG